MQYDLKTPWYSFYDGVREHLDYPNNSAYELLEESAAAHLDHVSYNYFGTKNTYKGLLDQIDKCARAFKSLGVSAGDKVSICMPNTPEAIISFYAINKIGAVANMIHPLSAEPEIKNFLNVSESRFIVTIDLAFNKINHVFSETDLEAVITVSVADSMPLHMKLLYKLTKGRKVCLEKMIRSSRGNILWD